MAGGDILWKNVEAMKEHPPSDSQDALRRSQSRAQRDRRIDAVSPSVSENEDRSGSMSATPETVPDMDVSQAGNYSDRTMPSDRPYGRTRYGRPTSSSSSQADRPDGGPNAMPSSSGPTRSRASSACVRCSTWPRTRMTEMISRWLIWHARPSTSTWTDRRR